MANKTHIKKIHPMYFYDILFHGKRFEIRKNDCDYQVGDKVKLVLYNGNTQVGTDSYIIVKITYILKDIPQYGLELVAEETRKIILDDNGGMKC